VYPPKKSRDFHELSFLAKYFDTVEINVTFYRPLAAEFPLYGEAVARLYA